MKLLPLLILSAAIGCHSDADERAVATEAVLRADAVARAQQWVDVNLRYCWSGADQFDSHCGWQCERDDPDPASRPYRSDCSGLVSWAWLLPAPGRVTTQFAPYNTQVSHEIDANDLRPGDAVNNDGHIMLFKSWENSAHTSARFLQESNCDRGANEIVSNVSIDGSTIHVDFQQRDFFAIRYIGFDNEPAGEPVELGSTITNPSFEQREHGWRILGSQNIAAYRDPARSYDGEHFLETNAIVSGGSIYQDVALAPVAGRTYTFELWARTPTPGTTATVTSAVYGLGGPAAPTGAATAVVVDNTWQRITVSYTADGGRSALRLQLYVHTVGINVDVDSTALYDTNLVNPSGEAGTHAGWQTIGQENIATYCNVAGRALDGACFIETNAITTANGESIFQDVPMAVTPGHDYTFEIWARTPVPGETAVVTGAVFGLGAGTPTAASTTVTLDNTWRRIGVTYTPTAAVTVLRTQLYVHTIGVNLDVDAASLRRATLANSSFEVANQWSVLGAENLAIYSDRGRALDGAGFLETNAITLGTGASVYQDLAAPLVAGRAYTFEVWARTPVPGQAADVTLALWGLGGAANPTAAATNATVGNTWQRVRATFTPSESDRGALRAQLYMNTAGVNVDLDAVSLH